MRNLLLSFLMLCLLPGFTLGADITVTNADITGTVNWTNDNTYILDGLVFVESGEVLNIQAGTVIKGMEVPTTDFASALIVARGGQIFAIGTETDPIIFTTDADDVNDPNDLDAFDRGLWGGVIMLGDATINTSAGEGFIEGIPPGFPGEYGDASFNFDDNHNGGTLQYVSIRHGGAELEPNNEINGLTLGAVGAGTTIEYVEVYGNLDDGIEFFGGTVRMKNIVVAFPADDSYDYDEGFNGSGQYWFAINDNNGDHTGEHDGGTTPEDGTPYAIPRFSNLTYIGAGACSASPKNPYCFNIRDNAGGKWYNSIFADHAHAGITVEDLASGEDSRARLEAGDIEFSNNLWYGFGDGNTWNAIAPQSFVSSVLSTSNTISDPQLRGLSRIAGAYAMDPRPLQGGPADGNFVSVTDDTLNFFDDVDYLGAFDPNADLWIRGWTALDTYGFIAPTTGPGGTVTVTNDDVQGGYMFFANTTYELDGLVFAECGETFYIEPGTVIKGMEVPTTDFASAMIVARGGHIYAKGTAADPIIFTTDADDVTDPNDLDAFDRGLWGGLIMLGNATINTSAGEGFIEGLTPGTPGEYGDASFNFDDNHNAGVLQYVSIRHGGAELEPNNEINGLTLGAVGAGTDIDYVEVYGNLDDGVEWFGGTVRAKHLFVAFPADDSFDYDEGFNGSGQFWFAINDNNGDHTGEHDGGTTPEDGTPFAIPRFSNVTYMGAGVCSASPKNPYCFNIRDNAGGKWYNSIFTDHAHAGITVEDLGSGADSRERLEAGDIEFSNNIWFGFGDGNTWDGIAPQSFVSSVLSTSNTIVNPGIRGLSRVAGAHNMDPRPISGGPADGNFVSVANDTLNFFDDVDYLGAFDPNGDLWIRGWTALDTYGFVAPTTGPGGTVTVTNADVEGGYTFFANTTYEIDGFVFAECGETFYIEPGTVIKGMEVATSDFASAMIVARGGYIYAMGTEADPIIMTTDADDVTDPNDLDAFDRGLWGGLIMLGNATINTSAGEGFIEGLTPGTPGEYGDASFNFDDNHSAGVLHYLSIRHGGAELEPNNEINGLTLGAVGAGTDIDYVEIYGNLDDGVEWFGGTVRAKHLLVAFPADDSFDYDEGFNGAGQYWYAVNDNNGDHTGEHDGGTTPEDGTPYAIPRFSNLTYLGAGEASASPKNPYCFNIRDNAGGKWYNSIFADHAHAGITIEDLASGEDSQTRLANGDIEFANNLWYGFGDGNTWAAIAPQAFVATYFSTVSTDQIVDPELCGLDRTAGANGLSAVPAAGGAADGTAIPVPSDTLNFFDDVAYIGAFDPNGTDWTIGWTALDTYGFIKTDCSSSCCDLAGDANNDGGLNIGDAVYLINHIFKGGAAPVCMDEGDANADCSLNIGDAVYLINHIFKGGAAPTCGCIGSK
ncbi:MAG: hypothetical protein R3F48_02965 [Candidatus Zixiibacteriota bacterium]